MHAYSIMQYNHTRGRYANVGYNVTVFVESKLLVETDQNLSVNYSTCKEYRVPKVGYNFRVERESEAKCEEVDCVNLVWPNGLVGFVGDNSYLLLLRGEME